MKQDTRKKVKELCKIDLDEAYNLARKTEWYWYRVQALATVARHTKPRNRFIKITKEALQAACETQEPNRTLSCSAWVLSAMAERNDVSVQATVEDLLKIIEREVNPVCQADALLLLFEAIYYRKEVRKIVLSPLIKACQEMRSWKQPRILKDIALIVAIDDLALANEVVEMIKKDSIKRQAKEAIRENDWLGPHDFFPFYVKTTYDTNYSK